MSAAALAPRKSAGAMRRRRVLELVSKDERDRKIKPPIAGMIRAAGEVLPKIQRIEAAWTLLMICRTVGLPLSPQSSLAPKRLARLRLVGEIPNKGSDYR